MREHLGRLPFAGVDRQLAVGRGEVVVPEQRHLLLQRAPAVDHAEDPALACILDVDVGREEVFGGNERMVGASDALIDVVGSALVVDEIVDRSRMRHVAIDVDVRDADAKTGTTKQVIDFRVDCSHAGSERDRDDVVRERGVVLTQ